ncbi:hypothetical protein OQA88_4818 [Cercophora sp. LCS_1]
MKYTAVAVLFASAVSTVSGVVVGNIGGDIAVSELLPRGEGGVQRVFPGNYTCHATDLARDKTVDVWPLWSKVLPELKESQENYERMKIEKMCTVYKHHAGCIRHVCHGGAALFVCANNIHETIPIYCRDIAFMGETLIQKCRSGEVVAGSITDQFGRFTVEVHASPCKEETRTTYFYGECHKRGCTPSEFGTNGIQP